MALPLFVVDAFTQRPFAGNPAAVCLLPAGPYPEAWLQAVAAEMNLSETAFLLPRADGAWDLRWFTPQEEVDLCGHATLASAHVLFSQGRADAGAPLHFQTRSGVLTCQRDDAGRIHMDFPADPVKTMAAPQGLDRVLGARMIYTGRGKTDLLVELGSAERVRTLKPDFATLRRLPHRGVIVTAEGEPGSDYDFVSRFFGPAVGIDEDPVTGSAHCTLATYWAKRLEKTRFVAYQASARGGKLEVELLGERVALRGHAVTVSRAELLALPPAP